MIRRVFTELAASDFELSIREVSHLLCVAQSARYIVECTT